MKWPISASHFMLQSEYVCYAINIALAQAGRRRSSVGPRARQGPATSFINASLFPAFSIEGGCCSSVLLPLLLHFLDVKKSAGSMRLILLVASLCAAARAAQRLDSRGELHNETDLSQRHEEISRRLARQEQVGIMKLSGDPSEKFYPEYWIFDHEAEDNIVDFGPQSRSQLSRRDDAPRNMSLLLPPMRIHLNDHQSLSFLNLRHFSSKRSNNYKCPGGTKSCAGINAPNKCCSTGSTCVQVKNTGHGTVGCCPPGESCSGVTADCLPGYKQCPVSSNGGCCVPGFQCDGTGCKFYPEQACGSLGVLMPKSRYPRQEPSIITEFCSHRIL